MRCGLLWSGKPAPQAFGLKRVVLLCHTQPDKMASYRERRQQLFEGADAFDARRSQSAATKIDDIIADNKTSLNRTQRMIAESEETGAKSLQELKKQGGRPNNHLNPWLVFSCVMGDFGSPCSGLTSVRSASTRLSLSPSSLFRAA